MGRGQQKKPKTTKSEEVGSAAWDTIKVTEQEEDLICRMYRLVGERWDLISGRVPGRSPEEIKRFWTMRHREGSRKEQ